MNGYNKNYAVSAISEGDLGMLSTTPKGIKIL